MNCGKSTEFCNKSMDALGTKPITNDPFLRKNSNPLNKMKLMRTNVLPTELKLRRFRKIKDYEFKNKQGDFLLVTSDSDDYQANIFQARIFPDEEFAQISFTTRRDKLVNDVAMRFCNVEINNNDIEDINKLISSRDFETLCSLFPNLKKYTAVQARMFAALDTALPYIYAIKRETEYRASSYAENPPIHGQEYMTWMMLGRREEINDFSSKYLMPEIHPSVVTKYHTIDTDQQSSKGCLFDISECKDAEFSMYLNDKQKDKRVIPSCAIVFGGKSITVYGPSTLLTIQKAIKSKDIDALGDTFPKIAKALKEHPEMMDSMDAVVEHMIKFYRYNNIMKRFGL